MKASSTSNYASRLWRFVPGGVRPLVDRVAWALLPRRRRVSEAREFVANLAEKGAVVDGPFRGMRLTATTARVRLGSCLIGSYEAELHPFIEQFIREQYDQVIDIGCAEGYYAIGLALRMASSQIYAFDNDQAARDLCAANAKANDTQDRVVIGALCTSERLTELIGARTLIISDCEGCELELLDPVTTPSLRKADFLIELHDFVDPMISSTIMRRFQQTHDVALVTAQPRNLSSFPALRGLKRRTREYVVNEGRPIQPHPMQWAVLRRRSTNIDDK